MGGVRNIKNVSGVSKAVMENTGHVMLVGEGAERFAVAMGFPRERDPFQVHQSKLGIDATIPLGQWEHFERKV